MPQNSHWILRRLGHLDGMLLTLVVLLLGVSLAMVASASGQSPARISGHLINIGLALSVMVVMANVPPHILSKVGPPLYVAGVILLIGVALFGEIRNGARRWLNLGFAFQPSELLSSNFNYQEYLQDWYTYPNGYDQAPVIEKVHAWSGQYDLRGRFVAPTLAEAQAMGAPYAQDVPEPSTFVLMAIGFATSLAVYLRRR